MTKTYEGMFLLDNRVVRENWRTAKAIVTDLLEKHGGKVITARRWDERQLAYPIKKRNRATYLLAYYELEMEGVRDLRRDLDLSERILRYLLLRVDAVPEEEFEQAKAELADDFTVPPPPEDHVRDDVPEAEEEGGRERRRDDRKKKESKDESGDGDGEKGDGDKDKGNEGEGDEASAEDKESVEEATTSKES